MVLGNFNPPACSPLAPPQCLWTPRGTAVVLSSPDDDAAPTTQARRRPRILTLADDDDSDGSGARADAELDGALLRRVRGVVIEDDDGERGGADCDASVLRRQRRGGGVRRVVPASPASDSPDAHAAAGIRGTVAAAATATPVRATGARSARRIVTSSPSTTQSSSPRSIEARPGLSGSAPGAGRRPPTRAVLVLSSGEEEAEDSGFAGAGGTGGALDWRRGGAKVERAPPRAARGRAEIRRAEIRRAEIRRDEGADAAHAIDLASSPSEDGGGESEPEAAWTPNPAAITAHGDDDADGGRPRRGTRGSTPPPCSPPIAVPRRRPGRAPPTRARPPQLLRTRSPTSLPSTSPPSSTPARSPAPTASSTPHALLESPRGLTPAASPAPTGAPPAPPASARARAAARRQLIDSVPALFARLNSAAFDGRLPTDLPISWSSTLRRTAGLTRFSTLRAHGGAAPARVASIELAAKVLDTPERLEATLLHELCHAAAWLLDGQARPPHGPHFWAWARRAAAALPGASVSTCHSYEIHCKHRFECTGCDQVRATARARAAGE